MHMYCCYLAGNHSCHTRHIHLSRQLWQRTADKATAPQPGKPAVAAGASSNNSSSSSINNHYSATTPPPLHQASIQHHKRRTQSESYTANPLPFPLPSLSSSLLNQICTARADKSKPHIGALATSSLRQSGWQKGQRTRLRHFSAPSPTFYYSRPHSAPWTPDVCPPSSSAARTHSPVLPFVSLKRLSPGAPSTKRLHTWLLGKVVLN